MKDHVPAMAYPRLRSEEEKKPSYAVGPALLSNFSRKEVSKMNLNLTKSLGMLLLGIWLIVSGMLTVLSVGNPVVHVLLALLAVAAGIFIVLGR
jgi:hypothetical protein